MSGLRATISNIIVCRTKTAWVTSTANPSTDFVSSTTTVYTATVPSLLETITKTETQMATLTATQSVTTTVTVTGSQNQQPPPTTTLAPLKRGAQGGKPEPPKCMVTKCFVYSPERITAGCSCIGVPPKTVTISQTAPCSTITVVCLSLSPILSSSCPLEMALTSNRLRPQ